jgi:hypothetical protein
LHVVCVQARRIKSRTSSHSKHAEGLETEHEFELIAHHTANSSGWDVTSRDRATINQITTILNPRGADSAWRWSNENSGWTFGLVKLTAQTPKGSLALHMIHRHGLGPLIAGRAGKVFTDFMSRRMKRRGISEVDFLVESQEEFQAVKELRGLLESLTLSGLRNLHSYDHQWSVDKWSGKVSGCSQSNGGGCILQAGLSATAYSFLTSNGFTHRAIQAAQAGGQQVMQGMSISNDAYGNYATPSHTGSKQLNFNLQKDYRGNYFVAGNVYWEDGGLSRGVRISLTSSMVNQLRQTPSHKKNALYEHWFEQHMEKEMRDHKSYMLQNRLKVWANEQADFVEMYPKTRKASGGARPSRHPWY